MKPQNCRMLEPLLAEHFPQMVGSTSEEWRSFLNAQTGLTVGPLVPNGEAFDRWRKALAKNGYPDLWVF